MKKRENREMWKRKRKAQEPKTQNQQQHQEEGNEEMESKSEKGFFACYLLTSLSPRAKGHTYIGYTVNPRRRIRQHNGEIGSGAWRTKRRRPWEMVLCIYGFPTNVSALQFEWAWQHPTESVAVRQAAATFKSFSGVANKIKLAYTMLNLSAWESLNITVNYFSTKYMKSSAACPSLPKHMKVQLCVMDELPCYEEGDVNIFEEEDGWNDKEEYDDARDTDGMVQETNIGSSLHISTDYLGSIDNNFGKDDEGSNTSGTTQEGFTVSPLQISGDYLHSIDQIFSEKDDDGSNASETLQETNTDFTPYFSVNYLDSQKDKAFSGDDEASNSSEAVHADKEICNDARGHNPADFSPSIGLPEGCRMRQFRDSRTLGVDDRRPVGFFQSLVTAASSKAASFSTGKCGEDGDLQGSTKENAIELEWSGGKQSTSAVALDEDHRLRRRVKKFITAAASEKNQHRVHSSAVSREVEVIDLLSPSPDCRISSCSKKRRVSIVSPVIIDLT
ncbi:GIY-YIG domain-containing protein [Cephalotus follicularis]|uniref:Structure-specific endonuclease subunit SLX1 homolog n=1 Tax=Cephalotus follicularis TaxID=3775 RepID=A0A1Q3ASC1_CEPFO|nr:GIY-YIG domain-containing protein [Cephalotus follicularis]